MTRRIRPLGLALCAILIIVLLFTAAVSAAPQTFSMGRHLLSGGGGRVVHGDMRLRGDVGQPIVMAVTQTGTDLCAGFWCTVPVYEIYLPLVMRSAS
mgnify:CR=1 FL=1|jgi:hypothetical protein